MAIANATNSLTPLVQIVRTNTVAIVTCATTVPFDNTIPQNTEGDEVLTLTITPKNANNYLHFSFECSCGKSATASTAVVALYQDTTADAIYCSYNLATASSTCQLSLNCSLQAGAIAATTYKIRVGGSAATLYVNGSNAGAAIYGGVSIATFTITEYSA